MEYDQLTGLIRVKMYKAAQRGIYAVVCALLLTVALSGSSLAYPLNYDADGNLVADDKFEYSYDGANRLKEVKDLNGSSIARYWYDTGGQRIKKELADGAVTYYPFENYEETQYPNGTVEKVSYYFANGERVAKKVQVSGKADETSYYIPDHLGSTSVVTDGSGQVVEKTKYYPFGAVLSGGSERYGYTGQENDPESELMYYNARYYNPGLMRFAQPDSLLPNIYDPQQLNRYSYVKNNPLRYNDPSGHWITPEDIADYISLADSLNNVWNNPSSVENWGWLLLDIGCSIVPVVGGVGAAGKGIKAGGEIANGLDGGSDISKAGGNIVDGAKTTDNLDEVGDLGKGLNRMDYAQEAATLARKNPTQFLATYNKGAFSKGRTYLATGDDFDDSAKSILKGQEVNHLDVDYDIYKAVGSKDDWWDSVNKPFIDDAMARGDAIIFGNSIKTADKSSTYYREWEYVHKSGYKNVKYDF